MNLADAIRDFAAVMGREHVLQESELLASASTATFATSGRALAIVRPGDSAEVQQVVRIANTHRIPVFPFSSGKNWGYGSRAPIGDAILIDLGRLNRIIEFDEDLAYVTIEPGVTQRQLHAFLQQRGAKLWMDATGASPDCSIVGNTMERGFGHTPMGDHCGTACGFEVVLPTGERIHTGFARFKGHTGALTRWGVGPSLDGLFSQSNLGIVTKMSVWLMPAPECFEAFFFLCGGHDELAAVVDAITPLRLNGTLRSTIHIGNDYKVLAATARFPWDNPDVPVPIDERAMAMFRKEMGIGGWSGSGGLYGTRAQVKEAKRQLRRALRGKVRRLQFVNDTILRLMTRFSAPVRWITGINVAKTVGILRPVYGLLRGAPTDGTLGSAYWRKRSEPPEKMDMDPDRDGCGLLWCSPVLPSRGTDVRVVVDLATRVVLDHGFEPQMSLSLATERSAICVITISYDRSQPDEDRRAAACYNTLVELLADRGYPPYRLNTASMQHAATDAAYAAAVRAIKQAWDPHSILAPGRYVTAAAAAAPESREVGLVSAAS